MSSITTNAYDECAHIYPSAPLLVQLAGDRYHAGFTEAFFAANYRLPAGLKGIAYCWTTNAPSETSPQRGCQTTANLKELKLEGYSLAVQSPPGGNTWAVQQRFISQTSR